MTAKNIALPQLPFSKIIRDYIHGYIQLTTLEYQVIQLPALNRLHNIKQLATAYLVYPCAKATRFEHSLGVMHIASRMMHQILHSANQEDLKELFSLDSSRPREFEENSVQLIQKVRLAALLHDIGHGPYSHATESILEKALEQTELEEASKLFNCDTDKVPFHEYFSYKMITSNESEIKKLVENSRIRADDIANLLIGRETESISVEGTGVIKKLISSQLDADRMDYLLRDAYTTGVVFGQTDIDRVIMNLSLRKDRLGKYELAIHERALMNIEDMIDARFKMYKWVYNHHLIVALDLILEAAILSMIEDQVLKYKDFHWRAFSKGGTDESLIHSKLNDCKNDLYKGLVDRRYAPTSLFKRTGDHDNFVQRVRKEMGRHATDTAIVERIEKWFAKIKENELPITVPKGFEILHKMHLFTIQRPRSPYKELEGTENIWVHSDIDDELKELITQSNYVKAINMEWQAFPSFYSSFIIPGIEKSKTKVYKEKIIELIAKEIAAL